MGVLPMFPRARPIIGCGGLIDRGLVNLFIHMIFCNFNIIINLVVAPTCCRNLHRQPLHHLTRLVETRLMIELDFEIYLFSMELQSFEKPYVTLLYSANPASWQPIYIKGLKKLSQLAQHLFIATQLEKLKGLSP